MAPLKDYNYAIGNNMVTVQGGFIQGGWTGNSAGTTNALLGLAALTLGLDDVAQRDEFYARAKNIMTQFGSPEGVYAALIQTAYDIKFGKETGPSVPDTA